MMTMEEILEIRAKQDRIVKTEHAVVVVADEWYGQQALTHFAECAGNPIAEALVRAVDELRRVRA